MPTRPIRYSARPSFPTPPLTEVDAARLRIAFRRFEVETVQARAAAGDPEAIESLPTHKAELAAMIREANLLEGIMSTIARRDETIASWREKVGAFSRELTTLQGDAAKLPPAYVASEMARLRSEISWADKAGREAFRLYLVEAATASATLRAKAEAEGDQQRSIADELMASRLTRSATGKGDAQDLMAHARRLIQAGQPLAAKPYMLALDQVEHKPVNLGQLRNEYRAAMDEVDPILSQAAAVERTARDAATTFEVERSHFLAEVGLGVDPSGAAGRGTGEQLATASIREKLTRYRADPEHYSEPAPLPGARLDGSPDPKATATVAPIV
ncbi:MAG TPA: hypothetical protein VIK06_06545 [Candidatus Limnocylindrales bacterium]